MILLPAKKKAPGPEGHRRTNWQVTFRGIHPTETIVQTTELGSYFKQPAILSIFRIAIHYTTQKSLSQVEYQIFLLCFFLRFLLYHLTPKIAIQ